MSPPFELRLPGGVTMPLSAKLVADLEAAVRAWHRHNGPHRDLLAEIEAHLGAHRGASTIEIARGIGARDYDVRQALKSDFRFLPDCEPASGPGRARRWMLAVRTTEPVPAAGTGTSTGIRGNG